MFCCLKNWGNLEYNSNDNLVILINYGNYENIVVEHSFLFIISHLQVTFLLFVCNFKILKIVRFHVLHVCMKIT